MKKTMKILCLAMLCTFMVHGAYAEWVEREKPIKEGINWYLPAVDGNEVIVEVGGIGRLPAITYYLYDAVKEKETKLLVSLPSREPRALYNKKIVFRERYSGEIRLYDIVRKKTTVVGKGNTIQPDIHSDMVVYGDEDDIVLYDIKQRKEKRVGRSGRMPDAGSLGQGRYYMGPSVYKGAVAWIEQGEEGWGLFLYNVREDKVKKLIELAPDVVKNINVLLFRDNVVLISNQRDVYIYKVLDGTFKRLTQPAEPGPCMVFASNINKGKVVWDSCAGEVLNVYDIAKDEYMQLVSKGARVKSGVSYVDNRILFVDREKQELRMFEFKPEKK